MKLKDIFDNEKLFTDGYWITPKGEEEIASLENYYVFEKFFGTGEGNEKYCKDFPEIFGVIN